MTVIATAAYISPLSHPADSFRRVIKDLRATQGVVKPADMAVTQNGSPNMSVNVAAGSAAVDGTQDTLHQGGYDCLNDATVNLSIAASDPTNPRIDIVCISIQDAQYSGAANQALLQVVTGTPAPSPSPPATPANSIVLAQVAVAATASTVVNANITDKRTFVWQTIQPGNTGLAILDSTGAKKNVQTADSGTVTFRGPLVVPPSVDGAVPPTAYGTLPLKFDEKTPSGVATVTFSLPSGFTHAHFRGQVRSDAAAINADLYAQFNGDSAADYVFQQLFGNNNAAASAQGTAAVAQAAVARVTAASATASIGATFSVDIENYSGTTFIKEAIGYSTSWEGGAAANEWLLIRALRWNSTAALMAVLFGLSAGNFVAGSKISGYVWP